MSPKVSVVTLNWNGKEDTLECLESLQTLTYPDFEIILVDNGSTDGSEQAVRDRFHSVQVIQNGANIGFAEGIRPGIELALAGGCDYVLVVNNDTRVTDRQLLNRLVGFAERTPDAGLVSPVILYTDSDEVWFAGGRISYLSGFSRHIGKGGHEADLRRSEPYRVDYVSGCCMLVSRSLLERVGLFDPSYFFYYEDVDLCFRARTQGFYSYVVPAGTFAHRKSAAAGIAGKNRLSAFQAYYFAKNALIFARRNLMGARLLTFVFAQLSIRLGYNLLMVSNREALRMYLGGLKDGLKYLISGK